MWEKLSVPQTTLVVSDIKKMMELWKEGYRVGRGADWVPFPRFQEQRESWQESGSVMVEESLKSNPTATQATTSAAALNNRCPSEDPYHQLTAFRCQGCSPGEVSCHRGCWWLHILPPTSSLPLAWESERLAAGLCCENSQASEGQRASQPGESVCRRHRISTSDLHTHTHMHLHIHRST